MGAAPPLDAIGLGASAVQHRRRVQSPLVGLYPGKTLVPGGGTNKIADFKPRFGSTENTTTLKSARKR